MRELSPYFIRRTASLPAEETRILIEPEGETEQVYLRNYWLVIRKRLWFILVLCFCTVLTTAAVIFTMTPTYTAETTILIERQTPHVLNIQELVSESLV